MHGVEGIFYSDVYFGLHVLSLDPLGKPFNSRYSTMVDFWLAMKSYAYGIGWLVISCTFSIIGYKLFDYFTPIDFKTELEKGNVAFALMIGLFLLGLTFGILFLAASLA